MESKICAVCGSQFIAKKDQQQCCSSKCANMKAHETRKKYYNCQYCGKAFWKPDAFRKKYCCKACQSAAYSESHPRKDKTPRPVFTKNCAWCGKVFDTTYNNKIYCGYDCMYNSNLKQKREQWKEAYVPQAIICRECGTQFITECGDTHSVFCCQSCADKFERRQEHATDRHKAYMRNAKKEREKAIAKVTIDRITYEDIFRRDNGICQICGLPVLPKDASNNWDGTIDHIVPISLGGMHSLTNCQLAHRVCNSLKCQNSVGFSINWSIKSKENNYWQTKYNELRQFFM